ncbi:amino acid transporter [Bacillus sp. SL00103]
MPSFMELCLPLVSFYHWAHKMYLYFSKERFSRDYIRLYLSLSLLLFVTHFCAIALAVIWGFCCGVHHSDVANMSLPHWILFLVYGMVRVNTNSSTGAKEKQEFLFARKQILFACSVSFKSPRHSRYLWRDWLLNSLQYNGAEKMGVYSLVSSCHGLWFIGLALLGKMLGKLDTNGKWMNRINKASAVMI